MSSTLKKSSAIWHFERNNVIEICDGIIFDFYTGLPHMLGTTTVKTVNAVSSSGIVVTCALKE